ncbi:unnamed protein product [Coregonus sp. 'balchen']|nr:unnamed protein product [Coregonus sp. 'balchen']
MGMGSLSEKEAWFSGTLLIPQTGYWTKPSSQLQANDTETEYLNFYKNGAVGPEYLNTLQPSLLSPTTSNGISPITSNGLTPTANSLFPMFNGLPSPSSNGLYPTSNSSLHCVQKYQPQNSIDNPDYQQDFTPSVKTHANGHIPATENTEYLGPN